jgi:hypothetical protein
MRHGQERAQGTPIKASGLGDIGKKERKPKDIRASLCEVVGHDWQGTTSDKVQRCDRCGLVRQLIKGHWRHTFKVSAEKKEQTVSMTSLWEGILE